MAENFDFDRLERTAELLRQHRRPILVHDADVPLDALPPPDWDDVPIEGSTKPERKGLELLTLEELQAKSSAVRWVVKRVLPQESVGILFGASGTFKSFIALDMALHIAHGMPWAGHKTKQAPVIFIAAEGGAGIWPRIEAWHRDRAVDWHDAPIRVLAMSVDLSTECSTVFEAAAKLNFLPGLVVVDTMSQTFSGEENSSTEVAGYLRQLGAWFRDAWACAVLVIHHSGHMVTERPRGSSAIRANVDFMLGCHREEKEMLATLSFQKMKDGELQPDHTFSMVVSELGRDEDDEPITALVARAVLSEEEKQELVQHEAAKGRSGRNALLLSLAHNGMAADDLRRAFYEACDAPDTEARRQAYFRALSWAKKGGLLEIAEGRVLVIRSLNSGNGA